MGYPPPPHFSGKGLKPSGPATLSSFLGTEPAMPFPCPLCPGRGSHGLVLTIPRSERRLEHLGAGREGKAGEGKGEQPGREESG